MFEVRVRRWPRLTFTPRPASDSASIWYLQPDLRSVSPGALETNNNNQSPPSQEAGDTENVKPACSKQRSEGCLLSNAVGGRW